MQIEANTPTRSKSIGEFVVTVPQPFVAGPHTLTDGEASALNQVIAENIGNNLRAKLAAGIVEAEGAEARPYTSEEAQALVNEYITNYEMGVRQVGSGESRVVDPVEREARKLAKDKAKELVKANGLKLADVDLSAIAEKIYDNNIDALTSQAKKIVDAKKKAAANSDALSLEGLDIGVPAGDDGDEEDEAEAA